ncbi:hypothetical protein CALCODRAFT_260740 [Calocera cornea HHB12733]|uniref:Uncharacterized protein n=1 Tax=Calocera cornea HHB12733 TaxID=1353952 RepID=A0A165GIR2_9BASI|nr:hypothetical protein CALCODRAFT_260740 [Calocera cornea HHB12733]
MFTHSPFASGVPSFNPHPSQIGRVSYHGVRTALPVPLLPPQTTELAPKRLEVRHTRPRPSVCTRISALRRSPFADCTRSPPSPYSREVIAWAENWTRSVPNGASPGDAQRDHERKCRTSAGQSRSLCPLNGPPRRGADSTRMPLGRCPPVIAC